MLYTGVSLLLFSLGLSTNGGTRSGKNGGRRNFQIKLGLELINYGISLDWPDPTDASRNPPALTVRLAKVAPIPL